MKDLTYDEMRFQLEPGDSLILVSDGTTDALNLQGEFYDLGRFTDSICRHCHEGMPGFLQSLLLDLRQFSGGVELTDDVTMLALRRLR